MMGVKEKWSVVFMKGLVLWQTNQYMKNESAKICVFTLFSDDLDVSPDFFEYFAATYPILRADSSLWCVSAWNDNGKASMVGDEPGKLKTWNLYSTYGKEKWISNEPILYYDEVSLGIWAF